MAELIQILGKQEIGRYEIDDLPVVFGRSTSATVFIEDSAISREHCLVERNGHKFQITDLDSQNGTYINGKQIIQAYLKDGDEIAMGKYTIIFADDGQKDISSTKITGSSSNMLLKSNKKAGIDTRKWYLTVTAKNFEQTLLLQKADYLIGKHKDCEIELTGFAVERFHALIIKIPNMLLLINVADKKETLLNENPAGKKTVLTENDVISIGEYECKVFSRE